MTSLSSSNRAANDAPVASETPLVGQGGSGERPMTRLKVYLADDPVDVLMALDQAESPMDIAGLSYACGEMPEPSVHRALTLLRELTFVEFAYPRWWITPNGVGALEAARKNQEDRDAGR